MEVKKFVSQVTLENVFNNLMNLMEISQKKSKKKTSTHRDTLWMTNTITTK